MMRSHHYVMQLSHLFKALIRKRWPVLDKGAIMSDDQNGEILLMTDPFGFDDTLSQRTMAFYHIAHLTDNVKDDAVKDLCMTMLRKINSSIRTPSTAEIHVIEGGQNNS